MMDLDIQKLSVSKTSIGKLLSNQDYKLIVPDYQRPYSWDEEKCEVY